LAELKAFNAAPKGFHFFRNFSIYFDMFFQRSGFRNLEIYFQGGFFHGAVPFSAYKKKDEAWQTCWPTPQIGRLFAVPMVGYFTIFCGEDREEFFFSGSPFLLLLAISIHCLHHLGLFDFFIGFHEF